MMRLAYAAILVSAAVLLPACPQRGEDNDGSGGTQAASGRPPVVRGGWWAPAGNAQRTRRGAADGPEQAVKEQWALPVPIPAVLSESSFFKESPAIVVDSSGTCYCLALAIPAVAKEMEIERELLGQSGADRSTKDSMRLGAASISHDVYADIAPKQAWLYAISPAGELLWVLKVAGAPVGAPSLTADGRIVFGTYSRQVVDFSRRRSERGDPIEDVGSIYVVSSNGELVVELDPGGWLCAELVVADDGTILASVNDGGYDYRTPAPGERLVALEADGRIRWALSEGFYARPPAIAPEGRVYVPVETAYSEPGVGATRSHLLAADLDTGVVLWRHDCGDAPVGELAVGRDGTIYCGTERTWPKELGGPSAANFNPAAVNQLGRLFALSSEGQLLWSTPLDSIYQTGLALGPSDEIHLIGVEWGGPARPGLIFSARWWLKAYGSDGRQLWQYATEYDTHLEQLAVDAAGNVYLAGVWLAGWNPGVIAIAPDGSERWIYYAGGDIGAISVSNDGALLLAAGNSIVALASTE